MSVWGRFAVGTLFLLLMTAAVYIFREHWQPVCQEPFVQIGQKCYFFSTNRKHTFDYYEVQYKDRVFSVPTTMDWLHARFGCEVIDVRAGLISLESAQQMHEVANYMATAAHEQTHTSFWSSGHRGHLVDMHPQNNTIGTFYWHDAAKPMNYTNWASAEPQKKRFPYGFCVYIKQNEAQLQMGTEHCNAKMAYVCQIY